MEENKIILKRSFTIVEVIVVLSITAIFLGLGMANYQNYQQETLLKQESKNFVDNFELTKKKSASSELYNLNCINFNGYRLVINSDNKSYDIFFGCNNNYLKIQTFNLPENIVFQSVPVSNFYFPPMLDGFFINQVVNLRIKNHSIGRCINISINRKGVVRIDDLLVDC